MFIFLQFQFTPKLFFIILYWGYEFFWDSFEVESTDIYAAKFVTVQICKFFLFY